MTEKTIQRQISRREWASLAGIVATAAPLVAQQSAPVGQDLLKEQREANAKAIAALEEVALTPSDEPILRLVVK